MAEEKVNGIEKAAILLLTLGEDLASEVMKHMGPTDVQKVSSQMTRLEGVSQKKLALVADEFQGAMSDSMAMGGNEYVKNILTRALGGDRANAVMDRITEGIESGGLDALRWLEPKRVADIIRNEHPQTIAVIMSHLEPEQASQVISHLVPRLRTDVILRVATMESVSSDAMKELEETIKQHIASGGMAVSEKTIGGVKIAAEILNQLDTASETAIISDIEKASGDLAAKIQQQMFVFADLVKVDDRGMQTLLKEVSSEQLVLALKVADESLKEKFFKNMSERARDMLKEDMETRGPVKISDVEKTQQEIIKTARRLEQEGKLVIGGKGGEERLV